MDFTRNSKEIVQFYNNAILITLQTCKLDLSKCYIEKDSQSHNDTTLSDFTLSCMLLAE